MILDYSEIGRVKVDMKYYVKAMVEDFELEYKTLNKKALTPHTTSLFAVDDSPTLKDKRKDDYHA